tara:strand:+ start:24 stop:284 length:261 start_codon:yes stop_codon:yes gene_type:complete
LVVVSVYLFYFLWVILKVIYENPPNNNKLKPQVIAIPCIYIMYPIKEITRVKIFSAINLLSIKKRGFYPSNLDYLSTIVASRERLI